MLELTCRLCGETKPANKFQADKSSKLKDENGVGRRNCCYRCLYLRYREQALQRANRWYQANKELSHRHSVKWQRDHRLAYREYQKEYHRAWGKANPEKVRGYYRARRERERLNETTE